MAIRDPQAQAFSTVIEPNFDGGLIHNDWIKGTIFIKITKAQRNAIGPLFRSLQNDNTTACLVIEDGVIYKLINNPTTQDTTDSDWAPAISVANADTQIIPIGTWDITNTNPVLQDTDANGINGNFYYVQGAPNLTDVTIPGLFQNTTTQVINKDWILSVGTHFVALSNTTTWDNLNRPQSIIDYENGTVIGHTHTLSEVIGLISALAEKYDENDLADMVLDFADVPDSSIGNVAFLRKHFYDKSFVYSKDEVDILLSNKVHNEIPGRDVAGAHPANTISFTPETPSNWEEQPTEVEKGLNLLAEKYINGGSGIPEAPIDGNQYARKDAGWEEVIASGGSGSTISIWSNITEDTDILEGWLISYNNRLYLCNTTHTKTATFESANFDYQNASQFRTVTFDATVGQTVFIIPGAEANEINVLQDILIDGVSQINTPNKISHSITTDTVANDSITINPIAGQELVGGEQVAIKYYKEVDAVTIGIEEAPEDGNQYARKDAGWEEVIASGGSGTGVFEPVQDITELKALNTTDGAVWKDKWALIVEDEESWYRYDRDSAVSESLPKIVAPTTGPGRFFQTPDVDLSAKADKANVLELDNTTEFTPDGDYEPATKKYVVDNLPDISGKADKANVLELDNTTEFTPDGDYEPATKKYVLDNLPDISNKEDRADIITVTDNAGTYELDQDSKRQRLYKTTTSISANKSVDVKNGAEGSVFSWYLQVTGTIILNFTSSTQTCFSDSLTWVTKQLTIEGTTNSKIEIAGLYINGAWNIKVSGIML
jgi:hypothetical protein